MSGNHAEGVFGTATFAGYAHTTVNGTATVALNIQTMDQFRLGT